MTMPASSLSQVPGVQDGIPLFRSCVWHTYNWANYGPVYAGGAFTAVSVSNQTATTTQVNFTPQFSGTAKVEYYVNRGSAARSGGVACTSGTPTSITLQSLSPSTQYTFILVQEATLTDQTGYNLVQTGYSDQYTFATTGGAQSLPVISNVAVALSGPAANRTATITWSTNVPCVNKVNYGATVSYGSTRNDTTTPPSQSGGSVTLPKLTGGNTYHYQCASTGRSYANGLTATTTDATFVA